MARKWILEALCLAFMLLFVYAGASKLMNNSLFIVQISQNHYLKPFAGFLSIFLPMIELVIAVMLAILRWRKIALYAFTSLMIIFTIYIILILSFSAHLPCSCGGILSSLGWKEHLVFNIGVVLLGVVAIWLYRKEYRQSGQILTV